MRTSVPRELSPAKVDTRPGGIVLPGIAVIRRADRGEFGRAAAEILRQGPDELVNRGGPGLQHLIPPIDLKGRAFPGKTAQACTGTLRRDGELADLFFGLRIR